RRTTGAAPAHACRADFQDSAQAPLRNRRAKSKSLQHALSSYIATNTLLYPKLLHSPLPSFPLDRAGRLARDIVDDAIDPLDLVDDPRRHMRQELHVELIEVRGHAVGRSYCAQPHHVVVSAIVAHHA